MTVIVEAWPIETAESHAEVGDIVATEIVGVGKTNAKGEYAIGAKDRKQLARFADNVGNVNIDVSATDGTRVLASLPIGLRQLKKPDPSRGKPTLEDGSLDTLQAMQMKDMVATTEIAPNAAPSGGGGSTATPAPTFSPTPGPTETAVAGSGTDPASATGDPGTYEEDPGDPIPANDPFLTGQTTTQDTTNGFSCGWSYVADLGVRDVWVGGVYVNTSGVTGEFVYRSGASSTLGSGVSASGSYGSYTREGPVSVSSGSTTTYAKTTTLQHNYTGFRYGKYGHWCDYRPGYDKYRVSARYHAGGGKSWKPASSPTANYCRTYSGGQTFEKKTSTAYSYSTGASLTTAIGINLSARTGYETEAAVKYAIASTASTRKICGTHDFPANSPKRIVAKP